MSMSVLRQTSILLKKFKQILLGILTERICLLRIYIAEETERILVMSTNIFSVFFFIFEARSLSTMIKFKSFHSDIPTKY